jgi:hypothetical protein
MPKIESWSANFSNETLETLLNRVVPKSSGKVTQKNVDEIMALVRSMKLDQVSRIGFAIQDNGETLSFGLEIFMDDIESPDVEFITIPELLQIINQEHQTLCNELGM